LILDTNALSALAEGGDAATAQFGGADNVSLPVIVLGEYRFGIARSRHRREYERWLEAMISQVRILAIDLDTAGQYAGLWTELKEAGTPIPSNDAWIAALCRQHAKPLLSRDRHFDSVKGLQRVSW
jgi:tRNA(fMet)-specific endonuclease VapC